MRTDTHPVSKFEAVVYEPVMERFIEGRPFFSGDLDKSAKAICSYQLPGLICREKFQKGMGLAARAETGDRLAAVYIKGPHRYAVFTGDAGKEVSELLRIVEVFDDEFAIVIKIVFR